MVDALRRAREIVTATGVVVDIHPTADRATVRVGAAVAGPVETADAPARHQAATDAVGAAVAMGLFRLDTASEFDFDSYADTIEELAEHIDEDWRDARIGDDTIRRVRQLLVTADAKPSVRERVRLAVLRPLPLG